LNPNYVLGAVPLYQRQDDIDLVDYYVAQYDAEIRYVDEQLGRILDYLRDRELDGNTLIVLTSDHGESLGEHDYYFEHGMLVNEGSIRIPLVVVLPGETRPTTVEALGQNTDLLPTLLDVLGLPAPSGIDGRGLPGLRGVADEREYIYSCTPFPEYREFRETLRTRTVKLIRSDDATLTLYDLREDPQETTNVAERLDPDLRRDWLAALDDFGRRGASEPGSPRALPQELTERLRALGYVD
jgi:arylsulfatase A-like enzyme